MGAPDLANARRREKEIFAKLNALAPEYRAAKHLRQRALVLNQATCRAKHRRAAAWLARESTDLKQRGDLRMRRVRVKNQRIVNELAGLRARVRRDTGHRGAAQELYDDLRGRTRPHGHERAPRPTRRRERASASRDGPSEPDDPPPDPLLGLTPLQRALLSLRAALEHSRHDRRTLVTFADVLAFTAAALSADLIDGEERPE